MKKGDVESDSSDFEGAGGGGATKTARKGQMIKGPWTEEEDNTVRRLVAQMGTKKWSQLATHLPGRLGKQCRER